MVTAAWAAAATVIAVLAFLSGDGSDTQRSTFSSAQAHRLQLRVDRRVGALQERMDGLAESRLITGLAHRLNRLERLTARQNRQLSTLGNQQGAEAQAKTLSTLETRVAALEAGAAAPKADKGTTTP